MDNGSGLEGEKESKWKGKSLHYLPQLSQKFIFFCLNFKTRQKKHLSTFKTIHLTSLARLQEVLKTVLSFSFLFILVESLKNYSKSHKNHKIENIILLDST
jgi:hypothetical protein